MTPQQIFNKVVHHLMTQGCKSKDEARSLCMYRGPNGTSCAVGCLIPDDKYSEDLEEIPIGGICNDDASSQQILDALPFEVTPLIESLLIELQHTHDSYRVEDWPNKFTDLASQFSLDLDLSPYDH